MKRFGNIIFGSLLALACQCAVGADRIFCTHPPGYSSYADVELYCSEEKMNAGELSAIQLAIEEMKKNGKYKSGMAICSFHVSTPEGRIPIEFCDHENCDYIDVYLSEKRVHIFEREGVVIPDKFKKSSSLPLCFARK